MRKTKSRRPRAGAGRRRARPDAGGITGTYVYDSAQGRLVKVSNAVPGVAAHV